MKIAKLKIENSRKGITIGEILVVVAGIGLLIALTLPQFSKLRERQALKATLTDITSALGKARNETLASLNSSSYGVRFEAGQVIIFKGTAYSSGAPDNEAINLTSPAAISNVTLAGVSGASGELYFQRLTGIPSKTGTEAVSTSSYSKIITIGTTGNVSVN